LRLIVPSLPLPRIASEGGDVVVVSSGPLTNPHAKQIVQLTAQTQLPAIYGRREFVDAGGLMSYAVDSLDQYRRAATYVDKILKGTTPADLPVEQPDVSTLFRTKNPMGF
jgi:putative ABC transport system substrate-binding protein